MYYAISDPYIVCDDEYYKEVVLPINISILILVGLLAPIYIFIKLYSKFREESLLHTRNLRIFGFFIVN